jgi:dihydrofolate synthase/folylpolyglutamate synthase
MKPPIFKPNLKDVRFFMPHFPIFTGSFKSVNAEKVRHILAKFGNPQNSLKNIIHVVGTNGKGSSCAYLKSILMEAGFKVCVFTSPHLHAVNERIEINGNFISDEKLYLLSEKVRFACEEEGLYPTIFESLTVVAMLAFLEANADFNIFEAGMGGENDATNVFETVAGVLFTSLSLDHTRFLGDSLPEIALQKLGVLKKDKPCVFHPFSGEVLNIILQKVAEKGAKPFFFGRDYNFCKVEFEDGIFGLEYIGKNEEKILPLPPLMGEHQLYNLSAVLSLLEQMDLNLSESSLIRGIQNTKWAGRLEIVVEEKLLNLLPKGSEIWFDGAHNEGGSISLSNWLLAQNELQNILIVGKTRGTEVKRFLAPFKNIVKHGIAFEGKGEIYPEFASVLEDGFLKNEIPCSKHNSILEAFREIGKRFNEPVRVVICGSLYLARDLSFAIKGVN